MRGLAASLGMMIAGTAAANPRIETSGDACELGDLDARVAELASGAGHVRVETRRGAELEARVSFDDGAGAVRGPRVVTAPTCGELADAVAIVIAMAIPAAIRHHSLEASPLVREVVAAAAGGISSEGPQGRVILGFRLRGGAGSLTAELRGDLPEAHRVSEVGSIEVLRTELSISPCMHFGAFAVCGLASGGVIRGAANNLRDARAAYSPVLSAGARLAWEHAVGDRFTLRLHLDAEGLLTTTRFDVDEMVVWTTPRFEAAAGVGVLAHFP